MPLGYAYSPGIWPSLATALLLTLLSAYGWKKRRVPGALPFAVGSLLGAVWTTGSLMEVATVDLAAKIFWVKFQAAWQLPAVTAITCFVLEYTWPGRWLTRRNLVLLSVVPFLYWILISTNSLHQLIWRGFAFDHAVIPLRGIVNWVFIAYGYGLGIVNILLFAWLLWRSPPHRLPVAIMLVGQIGARAIYLLEMLGFIRSELPVDVIIMAFIFLVYAIALFGFRIFEPTQLARNAVIAQMRDGIVVLDPQCRVTSLNPAARAILRLPVDGQLGLPIRELVPEYRCKSEESTSQEAGPIEIRRNLGAETRIYSLESSSLTDWRGLEISRLLLLHDVTEQKRSEVRLVEQQRNQATLRERERLARELHDSLGQTLAATQLQASTARLLLARGETDQTDQCLEQLAETTVAAEADIRDYLLGVKTAYSADQPFFTSLCLYLKRFGQQYGLEVTLNVPLDIEARGLDPAIEVQLMRIIQEAVTNVRKHACAKKVSVDFVRSGPLLKVAVCDNGRGFDSSLMALKAERYGLQTMRERAEELGGRFLVTSQSGQGTRVTVDIPMDGQVAESS